MKYEKSKTLIYFEENNKNKEFKIIEFEENSKKVKKSNLLILY